MSLDDYICHLKVEADETVNDDERTQKICEEIHFIQNEMTSYVSEFGTFQCAFCDDAFNDLSETDKPFRILRKVL